MIRICLPTGSSSGWGLAGDHITAELSKLTKIGPLTNSKLPLLVAVTGPDLSPMSRNLDCDSCNAVGYAFIEKPSLVTGPSPYSKLICGSSWMQRKMDKAGINNTGVALQGVDYDIFKPAKDALPATPFTVFSGGKFELRKSQDIVIAAMKIFMNRHLDVRLIAAWGNHWSDTMQSMESSSWINFQYMEGVSWKNQVANCLTRNRICLNRVTIPDIQDNIEMAALYRQAHVGLFPNRCEAGTNLVMCEAIACGIPVIANAQTGHKDLSDCISMELAEGRTTEPDGWFEQTSIEEIVDNLELVYSNPMYYRGLGLSAYEEIRNLLSWKECAKSLLGYLET